MLKQSSHGNALFKWTVTWRPQFHARHQEWEEKGYQDSCHKLEISLNWIYHCCRLGELLSMKIWCLWRSELVARRHLKVSGLFWCVKWSEAPFQRLSSVMLMFYYRCCARSLTVGFLSRSPTSQTARWTHSLRSSWSILSAMKACAFWQMFWNQLWGLKILLGMSTSLKSCLQHSKRVQR